MSKGTAQTALTQMIGRVLRQPHAKRTGVEALDETHVFCAEMAVADAVKNIKDGLEAEGMGDLGSEIVNGGGKFELEEVTIRMRKAFRGKRIMVPKILHRDAKKNYRELDYEADVLALVDFEKFSYRQADSFDFADYDVASRHSVEVDIAKGERFEIGATDATLEVVVEASLDRPALIRRMLDVVPNPWQGARILDDTLAKLRKRAETKGKHLEGSDDTEFKGKFFKLLEEAYTKGVEAGEVDLFDDRPDEMRFRILIQESAWEPDLEKVLKAS